MARRYFLVWFPALFGTFLTSSRCKELCWRLPGTCCLLFGAACLWYQGCKVCVSVQSFTRYRKRHVRQSSIRACRCCVRWAVLGWQSLLVILDTSRFDQNADQLCCGCFWLWSKSYKMWNSGRTPVAPMNIIAVVTRCSDQGCHLKVLFVVLMCIILVLNTVNLWAARELL